MQVHLNAATSDTLVPFPRIHEEVCCTCHMDTHVRVQYVMLQHLMMTLYLHPKVLERLGQAIPSRVSCAGSLNLADPQEVVESMQDKLTELAFTVLRCLMLCNSEVL